MRKVTYPKWILILALSLYLGWAAYPVSAQNIEDRRFVCMMQDSAQVKEGVPIVHEGKTYYGCCPMCAEKMKADPNRYMKSVDPVSKAVVDKATAYIYAHNGTAYYFESEANRGTFRENISTFLSAN